MNRLFGRIKWLQVFRFFVQIVFFILLPGLYINAWSGIRQLYHAVIQQKLGIDLLPGLIGLIAVLPATILFGRFFCGWMCAFGTMQDVLYKFSKHIFKPKIKVGEKADHLLKYIKFLLLAFIVAAIWTFGILNPGSLSPWDAFGMLFTFGKLPDFAYVFGNYLPGIITLLLIILASFVLERPFCRYICPLGAVFSVFSFPRILKVSKPAEGCGSCRACTAGCTMGIPLYQKDRINSGECIDCLQCISACPRKNAHLSAASNDIRSSLAGALTVTVISGVYYAGSFTSQGAETSDAYSQAAYSTTSDIFSSNSSMSSSGSNPSSSSSLLSASSGSSSAKAYKDDTYIGSGTGYRGATTTVSVTVSGGKITNIKVLSYGDDESYFYRAKTVVIPEIINSQTTEVDTVSGATYSCNGIMQAVANALSKAK